MHMYCHLMQCILNYGPALSLWLYPVERYNGIMQSFVGNWECNDEEIYCLPKGIMSILGSLQSSLLTDMKNHF